jgi:hypothetical protein
MHGKRKAFIVTITYYCNGEHMKVVTARIEDEYFRDLKLIESEEHTERAEVVRKLLATGIRDWKTRKALEALKQRKATIRKAAALCGRSYSEILDLAAKADIDIGYSLDDLKQDR